MHIMDKLQQGFQLELTIFTHFLISEADRYKLKETVVKNYDDKIKIELKNIPVDVRKKVEARRQVQKNNFLNEIYNKQIKKLLIKGIKDLQEMPDSQTFLTFETNNKFDKNQAVSLAICIGNVDYIKTVGYVTMESRDESRILDLAFHPRFYDLILKAEIDLSANLGMVSSVFNFNLTLTEDPFCGKEPNCLISHLEVNSKQRSTDEFVMQTLANRKLKNHINSIESKKENKYNMDSNLSI